MRKLSDEIDITALREMEAQGMSRGEIAVSLGTSYSTLRRYLGASNKRGRRPGSHVQKKVSETVVEPVLSLQERLQKEIEEGKRLPPAKPETKPETKPENTLKVKQWQTVLEGDMGVYTLDMVTKQVTVSTLIHEVPVSVEDLRRVIRELQAVERELGGETA